MTASLPDAAEVAELGAVDLVPGYVDLQINGIDTVDFSVADGTEWLDAGRRLLSAGVTAYLPTICSMALDQYDAALARIAQAQAAGAGDDQAVILGVHLEGPFLGGAPGAHPRSRLRAMDVDWVIGLLDRHPGLVRLVTVAPEADPASLGIRALVERGVVVALGHTTCSYDDAVAAFGAGATLATHLFNGMGPLHHRAPGIVGAALDPRVGITPTVIGDFVHVHPAVVGLAFAASDPILVSDAVATGVPYFDSKVVAAGGAAYLPDGRLAGATSLLDDAVRNVVSLGVAREVALAAATVRPAAALGLAGGHGMIALDPDLMVRAAWIDGRRVS